MIQERRNRKIMVMLSPTERTALECLSERDGMSMADTLRRLIRGEAYQREIMPTPSKAPTTPPREQARA